MLAPQRYRRKPLNQPRAGDAACLRAGLLAWTAEVSGAGRYLLVTVLWRRAACYSGLAVAQSSTPQTAAVPDTRLNEDRHREAATQQMLGHHDGSGAWRTGQLLPDAVQLHAGCATLTETRCRQW